jgi:hypothetical protein
MAVVNQPALPPGASSEGVGRGRCARVLFHFRYVEEVLDFDCVPFSIIVGNVELESPLTFDC